MDDEPKQPTSSESSTRDPARPTHERPPFRPLYDLSVDLEGDHSEDQRRGRAKVRDPKRPRPSPEPAGDQPRSRRPPFRPLDDLIVDMEGGRSEDQRRKRRTE